jgi:outer membrane protein TolC
MKQVIITISLHLAGFFASAQQVLSADEFLSIVRRYHPVAKQAAVGVDIAKAEVTSARAGFDPGWETSIGRKEFDGLLYYDHHVSEVKIPTWYGVDVVAGIQSLNGERTSTPDTKGNSSYFGLSVPVAKGLLMDGRRAALQQAKIFQQLSVQEQRVIINDLLHDAAKSYWNWWQQVQVQRLFQQAIQNAHQRFRLVKTGVEIGERAAIDTLEALAQLQTFQLRATELQLGVTNANLDVNIFMWQQDGQPYKLPETVVPHPTIPPIMERMEIETLMQQVQVHPAVQEYRFKLNALQVEKKLKYQSLLPAVHLKYNQLNKSHNLQKVFHTPWLEDNYRYGVSISIPLRLSQGRGEYRIARLKIEQTLLGRSNKQIELQTKVRQYYNEWKGLSEQIAVQRQAVQSYIALQRGEEIKFVNGESSLFLVNARELKTLEAQQKLLELECKEQQAKVSTLWAAGVLGNY